jgi:hypothetical protein
MPTVNNGGRFFLGIGEPFSGMLRWRNRVEVQAVNVAQRTPIDHDAIPPPSE